MFHKLYSIMLCNLPILATVALWAQSEAFLISRNRLLKQRQYGDGTSQLMQCMMCLGDAVGQVMDIEQFVKYTDPINTTIVVDKQIADNICRGQNEAEKCLQAGPAACAQLPYVGEYLHILSFLKPLCAGNTPNSEFDGVLECFSNRAVQAQWVICSGAYAAMELYTSAEEREVLCRVGIQPSTVTMMESVRDNCSPASLSIACQFLSLDITCPQNQLPALCTNK